MTSVSGFCTVVPVVVPPVMDGPPRPADGEVPPGPATMRGRRHRIVTSASPLPAVSAGPPPSSVRREPPEGELMDARIDLLDGFTLVPGRRRPTGRDVVPQIGRASCRARV